MSRIFKFGVTCLLLVVFLEFSYATLGDDCALGGDSNCTAGNNEICSVDGSTECICDGSNNYAAGTEDSTTCFLPVNLNAACSDNGQCTRGNGATHSECSTNCVCSSGYTEDSSTCKKDCGNPTASAGYVPEATPSSTILAATATVSCETGYTGTAASITCEAGGWSAYSGCSQNTGSSLTKTSFFYVTVTAVILFACM